MAPDTKITLKALQLVIFENIEVVIYVKKAKKLFAIGEVVRSVTSANRTSSI